MEFILCRQKLKNSRACIAKGKAVTDRLLVFFHGTNSRSPAPRSPLCMITAWRRAVGIWYRKTILIERSDKLNYLPSGYLGVGFQRKAGLIIFAKLASLLPPNAPHKAQKLFLHTKKSSVDDTQRQICDIFPNFQYFYREKSLQLLCSLFSRSPAPFCWWFDYF